LEILYQQSRPRWKGRIILYIQTAQIENKVRQLNQESNFNLGLETAHQTMATIRSLPVELLVLIFENLHGLDDLVCLAKICTAMRNFIKR
jgi:hypothetical protein